MLCYLLLVGLAAVSLGQRTNSTPPYCANPAALLYSDAVTLKAEIEEKVTKHLLEVIDKKPVPSYYCPEGLTADLPATSCKAMLECNKHTKSGHYWIKTERAGKKIIIQRMYCDMETVCGGVKGGWMQVAHLDMKNPQQGCPTGFKLVSAGSKRLCIKSVTTGCSSTVFDTCGIPYSHVCGKAKGFAYYSPDGFGTGTNDIQSNYVDGLSITHGNPRRHIWTYAAGLSQDGSDCVSCNCPCAVHGNQPPHFFLSGQDFHCESGNRGRWEPMWYLDDPLWDGQGCATGDNCCAYSGLPWFSKTLPTYTTDDIEARLCCDQAPVDEDVGLEELEILIQ